METRERKIGALSGALMFVVWLALAAGTAYLFTLENGLLFLLGVGLGVLLLIGLGGFIIVQPNNALVLTLFGRYVGTQRENGWYFINPLTSRKTISLRIRNFNSERQKVNDHDGNPIEIAAVIVWRVVDSARASFDVENYEKFVGIQTETALRHLASRYPYDAPAEELSLRGSADELAKALEAELTERLLHAGVTVLEARLSHLAYAPEIAAAMLQRQQAGAIIAARAQIVAGAVGMVQMALEQLERDNIVHLDDERKAQMVSNLLVVLTSERGTQPVVNAGSLY